MDPGNATVQPKPSASDAADPEAIEFVRFCYRRRRVGWPELYDEMCAVAGRGLYRGLGSDELGDIGIGLSLFDMPALAALVQRIVAEDLSRRRVVQTMISPTTIEVPRPGHQPSDPGAPAESSATDAPDTTTRLAAAAGV